jgi:hypothetical protein
MKMIKAGLFILLFVIGCKEAGLESQWEEDKLVNVLADLRLIDGQIKIHNFNDKDSLRVYYKELLYEIHKINEEEIVYHLEYVQSDPALAKRIEDKIQDLLNDRLKKVQNYK